MSSIVIGIGAGPEKSEYDDKETFLPRDFSLFTSVILCCILNIRSRPKQKYGTRLTTLFNEYLVFSLMVFKRVKQRKDCDYGQQLR